MAWPCPLWIHTTRTQTVAVVISPEGGGRQGRGSPGQATGITVVIPEHLVVADLAAAFFLDRPEQGTFVGLLTPLAVAVVGVAAILNLQEMREQKRRTSRITHDQLDI